METTSNLAGGWLFLGILVSCALLPVTWSFIVKRQRKSGANAFIAHSMGLVAGFLAFLSALLSLIAIGIDRGYVGAAIFWGLTAWCLKAWSRKHVERPIRQSAPTKPSPRIYQGDQDDFTGEGSELIRKFANKPTAEEQELIDQIRLESIMAAERSGRARKKDMELRGETVGEPIWMEEFRRESRKSAKGRLAKGEKKVEKVAVSGSISFDYIDTKSDYSSRVVDVTQADHRHFSGYCRSAKAFRTFLLEGVVSDVTDVDTGEVMPIEDWVSQAIEYALNK
jgi:hypothetical protein